MKRVRVAFFAIIFICASIILSNESITANSIKSAQQYQNEDANLTKDDFQYTQDYLLYRMRQKQIALAKKPTPEQLKEQLKIQILQKLYRRYDWLAGTIIIQFYDKSIPDNMSLRDAKIITTDKRLNKFLEENGFDQFHIIGAKVNRERVNSKLYNFAYVHSPVLRKKSEAFMRTTYRAIDKLMQDFEVQLYEDKPHYEVLPLNVKRAVEYLKGKEISFELWDKNILFHYEDRTKDPFSLEIIKELELIPCVESAHITPKYYLASGGQSGTQANYPDYYEDNNMWNLRFSPGGDYPTYDEIAGMTNFSYIDNCGLDEDVDGHVLWDKNLDASQGGISLGTGEPVVIAVIDSGIDFNHPEFAGRIWINEAEDINHDGLFTVADKDEVDNDNNGYEDDVAGFNFNGAVYPPGGGTWVNYQYQFFSNLSSLPPSMPYDDYGHGTSVASIIGATDDGKGIKGIAYNSKILPIKIPLSTSSGLIWHISDALEYVMCLKTYYGVNIVAVNISLGGADEPLDPIFSQAIVEATDAGIVVVKCTGNEGASGPVLPGNYMLNELAIEKAIMVGASDYHGSVPLFSTYGNGLVDVVAPGVDIVAARAKDTTFDDPILENSGEYFELALYGTSLSTPYVTAMAALIAANNPGMSPEEIQDRIKNSAEILYDPITSQEISPDKQGTGKINLTGILPQTPPEITSAPPATATIPGVMYQIEAGGIIDPWFDWADGYIPEEGMNIDKGIGAVSIEVGEHILPEVIEGISIVAKNHMGESQQTFDLATQISHDPNDWLNNSGPDVGDLELDTFFYPDAESYTLTVNTPCPFLENIPIGYQGEPNPGEIEIHYAMFEPTIPFWLDGYPRYRLGTKVNGETLWGNSIWQEGWPPIDPNAYPFISGWNDWNMSISLIPWQVGTAMGFSCYFDIFFSPDPPEFMWPCVAEHNCWEVPGTPEDHQHLLLFANPPDLRETYGDHWDISMVDNYGGGIISNTKVAAYEEPGGAFLGWVDNFDGTLLNGANEFSLASINWQPLSEETVPEIVTDVLEGTIYYTNTKTDQLEPLKNTYIQISNIYSTEPTPTPPKYFYTDEEGHFTTEEEVSYIEQCPPILFILGRCRDDNEDNPYIIAEIIKLNYAGLVSSEEHYLEDPNTSIELTPTGDDPYGNAICNILMGIRKTYDYIKQAIDLTYGVNMGNAPIPPGDDLLEWPPVRDKIICTFGDYYDDSFYLSTGDGISFAIETNGYDPGWYEISHNYALSFLQWHFQLRNIEEIDFGGGTQNIRAQSAGPETPFKWALADLIALRTYGESQSSIEYNDQHYDIENYDFEDAPEITEPAKVQGVCAGILLDMVDSNTDMNDELHGTMSNAIGEDMVDMIFKNAIDMAIYDEDEFGIYKFYYRWQQGMRPLLYELNGIYLGHEINMPAPPGGWEE